MPRDFADSEFYLASEGDPTKKMRFDLTNLPTGTLVKLIMPALGGVGPFTLPLMEHAATWTQTQTFDDVDAGSPIVSAKINIPGDNARFLGVTDVSSGNALVLSIPVAGLPTALREQVLQDASGTIALRETSSTIAAAVNATAQSAAITSTTLVSTAGYYVVHYTIADTSTQVGVATVQFQIGYTDEAGATTQTGAALSLTAAGRDRGSFEVYLASGNLTYQTNVVGAVGTGRYALRVRVEALG